MCFFELAGIDLSQFLGPCLEKKTTTKQQKVPLRKQEGLFSKLPLFLYKKVTFPLHFKKDDSKK